jgi:VWFA-related protein
LKDKVVVSQISRTSLALSALVLALVVPAYAQGESSGTQAPTTFRAAVEAVTVSVTVRDGRGRVIRDLAAGDFEVLDGGSLQPISDFFAGEAPVSLAVLLDVSGSMAVGGNMDRAREAVHMVAAALQPPLDEIALFTFDSKLQQIVPFTTDMRQVSQALLEGRPWGNTSLFDSIEETAQRVAVRANRHRALLVITDGVDTASRLTVSEVSGIAAAIDVPVYLLAVVSPTDHPGGEFAVVPTQAARTESASLADLSRWTGGEMHTASRPAHTAQAVQDLMTELRHQYVISFEPGARPGWHPIEIRLRKKNMFAHTRGGYIAGPSRSGS